LKKELYSPSDFGREGDEFDELAQGNRHPIFRDYGRVIHSASFRRLQGKTQVFPGHESDFFRNRLTHSLEVAQIAEGIADRINREQPEFADCPANQRIDTRLCAVASLLHDLGHPPFGHNGERALDNAMRTHGGFEGNAQTLRIITRLEKKARLDDGKPLGLHLTYRTLASILKYDRKIPRSRKAGAKLAKGYYLTEAELVRKVKTAVIGAEQQTQSTGEFKTIECSIMDIADDIAYSTFDLEDSLKAGFLTPAGILSSRQALLERVASEVSSGIKKSVTAQDVLNVFIDIFDEQHDPSHSDDPGLVGFISKFVAYQNIAESGYFRTKLSSELVNKAINSIEFQFNKNIPALSSVKLSPDAALRVEVLKKYTYIATIYSSRVKLPEFRGYEVVSGIFSALAGEKGNLLMPEDVREQYEACEGDLDTQMRVVCDFVAGMTDRYAMEFYGRLHSDSAQSMFKPV
jgi:dGTPase